MAQQEQTSSSTRIIEAAIDLFHRNGYQATSLREVADAVDLQVGSLYNHISSKEELLFGIMHRVMSALNEEIAAAMGSEDDAVEQIRAFMRASIRFNARRRKEAVISNSELRALSRERREQIVALRDAYQRLLSEALVAAIDDGRITVRDLPLATYSGIAICQSVATWYRPDGRLSLEEIVDLLPELFAPLAAAVGPRGAAVTRRG